MKNKLLLIFLSFVLHTAVMAQQDGQVAHYIFNGLYINPAYAGYKEELYIQAFARAQWTGIQGAPQTLSVSVDEAVRNESLGLGLIVIKDKIGAQNTLTALGNIAYRIKLDRNETNVLAFGVGLGIKQLGLDGTLLDPKDQGDNRIPVGKVSQSAPEFRAGVFYSNEKYFIGFSASNLFSRKISIFSDYNALYIKPQIHFYFTAGVVFPINEYVLFKPAFLIKDDVNGPTALDLNSFILFKERVWLGAVYRTSIGIFNKTNLEKGLPRRSAVGLLAEYFTKNNFRIGYGYDFSLNKLQQYDYGSHEISLGYYFSTKKSRRPKCYF